MQCIGKLNKLELKLLYSILYWKYTNISSCLHICMECFFLCDLNNAVGFIQDYDEDGTLSFAEFSDLIDAFGNQLAATKVCIWKFSAFHLLLTFLRFQELLGYVLLLDLDFGCSTQLPYPSFLLLFILVAFTFCNLFNGTCPKGLLSYFVISPFIIYATLSSYSES